MSRTTPDPETPIFGELNEELGELPEIDVHDFDAHAFGLLTDSPESSEAASSDEDGSAASEEADAASQPTRISAGGRRRKED